MVALPWGSRSTTSTRWPIWARPAARLTVVVVLPTPPFWLAMQKFLDAIFYLDKASRMPKPTRQTPATRFSARVIQGLARNRAASEWVRRTAARP